MYLLHVKLAKSIRLQFVSATLDVIGSNRRPMTWFHNVYNIQPRTAEKLRMI